MRNDGMFEVLDLFERVFNSPIMGCAMPAQFTEEKRYPCPAFPPANISIDKDSKDMRFEFAIAGVDPRDVSISFSGDFMELKIGAEKTETEKEVERKYMNYGIKKVELIDNKYYVPSEKYNTAKTTAIFKNGILAVNIPVKAKDLIKPVSIKIET